MKNTDNKITAIIKTSNSEKSLYNTLESIKELDEVFVVDENSTDDTIEIAKEYRAKIIHTIKNELSFALNRVLDEATGDWIFLIKDNEIIPQKLIYEIKKYINNPKKNKNSVTLPIKTFYFKKEIKSLQEKKDLRIFKKGHCSFDFSNSIGLKLKNGKIYNINPNFELKNTCILRYCENDISKTLINILEKNKINLKTIKSLDFSLFIKPAFSFLKNYFLKGLIFDGRYGYILAVEKFIEEFSMQMLIMNKSLKGNENDI